MLNKIRQQEILLTYNSHFLSKIYFDKCNTGSSDIYIELEKIEEACWNGLLKEASLNVNKSTPRYLNDLPVGFIPINGFLKVPE